MASEIYLDNAATTPMAPEVIEEMMDKMANVYGNASTTYQLGRTAKSILEAARHTMAMSIGALDDEITFTSGGTESNNTAIIETAQARKQLGKHIISTVVEHESVLKPLAALEQQGFTVTYLPVDDHGEIRLADFDRALTDDTILVSIMTGNNEVGTRMPIEAIGERLINHQALLHTDAVQAFGLIPIDVNAWHVDLLSTSAHKLNGPKMMGFLYRRQGIKVASFLKGGDQENKRRAGTENIPAIAGFQTAVNLIDDQVRATRQHQYHEFKQFVIDQLTDAKVQFEVNGTMGVDNLQHVLNLWIKDVPTDALQTNLDLAGIAISGGSACTAGSLEPSHVLSAMFGENNPRVTESIRISFGHQTTKNELQQLVSQIASTSKRILSLKEN